MANLEVAEMRIRKIVEDLKKKGLPDSVSFEEMGSSLSERQREVLSRLVDLADEEQKSAQEGQKVEKGSEWWRVREEIRKTLQAAITADLIRLGFIQRHLITYGAIPDPKEDWKYYALPDGSYACWKCGAEIMAKNVSLSVHFSEFPLAGRGEVRRKQIPYCPNCEKEPQDSGIIRESVAESIEMDFK